MSKSNGLGSLLFVDGVDVSGDVGDISELHNPSGVLDVTGINASGMERILSHIDGAITFGTFFNDADSQSFQTLKSYRSANRIISYFKGSAIGNAIAQLVAKQVSFDWNRGNDGSLVGTIQAQGAAYGLEYGGGGGTAIAADGQLTAGKRTDTGATNGSSLDSGIAGGTALGCAAVLHVFSFTGTDATVKIQESSDDGAGDAFADVTGLSFTAIAAAPTAERLVTSLTAAIERYLRVVTTTTGGFSEMTFAVSHTRYPYAA